MGSTRRRALPRRRVALAAAALLASSLPAVAGGSGAGAQEKDAVAAASVAEPILTTDGLLSALDISPDLNCYVKLLGDSRGAFYGDTACATTLRVDGQDYSPADIPAGGLAEGTTFTSISAPALTGAGTPESPFQITTVVGIPGEDLTLTQVDSHVLGDNGYTTEVTITDQAGAAREVELYKAFDCYTADSDSGFGDLLGTPVNAVQCIGFAQATQVRNRAETLIAITPATSYMHGSYSQVWGAVGNGTLTNDCRCEEDIDNGAALGWDLTVPANGSVSASHRTEFRAPGQAVTNFRVLDTRPESQIGSSGAILGPDEVISVQVAGSGGIPSSGAESVFLNVTGTQSSGRGYVTAWPAGRERPLASSLNLEEGQTRPNLVFTRVGENGQVNLYTQSGGHVLADVGAYFPTGSAVVPLDNSVRLLDTRPATQVGYSGAKPGTDAVVPVTVAGIAGVPADAAGVILNVTGTEPEAAGYVTVWPNGATRPNASNLNLEVGRFATPNLVVVPVGDGGAINLYTQSPAHLLVDIAGYVVANSGFESVTPYRVLDTRPEAMIGYSGATPGPDSVVTFSVSDLDSPVPTGGVQSVILNVTVTQATGPGFVTAFPGGTTLPAASNLNVEVAGQTIANSVVVPVSDDGTVSLYTQAGGHLIADVAAWIPV